LQKLLIETKHQAMVMEDRRQQLLEERQAMTSNRGYLPYSEALLTLPYFVQHVSPIPRLLKAKVSNPTAIPVICFSRSALKM
jgi:hypothetical protein